MDEELKELQDKLVEAQKTVTANFLEKCVNSQNELVELEKENVRSKIAETEFNKECRSREVTVYENSVAQIAAERKKDLADVEAFRKARAEAEDAYLRTMETIAREGFDKIAKAVLERK
jgi:hypothetical protein